MRKRGKENKGESESERMIEERDNKTH